MFRRLIVLSDVFFFSTSNHQRYCTTTWGFSHIENVWIFSKNYFPRIFNKIAFDYYLHHSAFIDWIKSFFWIHIFLGKCSFFSFVNQFSFSSSTRREIVGISKMRCQKSTDCSKRTAVQAKRKIKPEFNFDNNNNNWYSGPCSWLSFDE